jgi:ribokinase
MRGAGMHIINFGSVNIDIIFQVDHIVRPGETIRSTQISRSTGGKGANQSVAVAKAGLHDIFHVGKIGSDGSWIKDKLFHYGVNTDYVIESDTPTGQALIQVAADGQNSIVLYSGSNYEFTHEEIDDVLSHFDAGDWIMLQNEINLIDYIITRAHQNGMNICLNPAPYDSSVLSLPLNFISLFVLNEVEAAGIAGVEDPMQAMDILTSKFSQADIIITLGEKGVRYGKGKQLRYSFGTWNVPVLDTTAAGDTFIGCYLANIAKGKSVQDALYLASAASSLTVMRQGAMDTIPSPDEFHILKQYTLKD